MTSRTCILIPGSYIGAEVSAGVATKEPGDKWWRSHDLMLRELRWQTGIQAASMVSNRNFPSNRPAGRTTAMMPNTTPSTWQIAKALKDGGLDAVDELHYPGEHRRHRKRVDGYPKPEGTGRSQWEPKTRYVTEFERPEYEIGIISRTGVWKGDVRLGHIERVRRGFCDNYYRAHDGQEFAHWGGPTGIETYLVERYWLYGDPPEHREKSPVVCSADILLAATAFLLFCAAINIVY